MSAKARRRRWRPSPGLGTQLAALSLVTFIVTLGAGGYATWTVDQLRAQAAVDRRIDALATGELEMDGLNSSLQADVLARFARLDVQSSTTDDVHALQEVAIELEKDPDEPVRALASGEYSFADLAQALLVGPTPDKEQLSPFRQMARALADEVDRQRDKLEKQQRDRAVVREASTRDALEHLLTAAVSTAVLLFGLSWLIRRRLLRALGTLAGTAQAVAAGDLSARTGRVGDDEVGRLARVLDETSEALQQAFAEREADARREAFRARLDRALAQVDDDEGLAETVGRALAQVAGTRATEVLIADSSEAHLTTFATNPHAAAPGCSVTTPWSCPAVRGGRVATFRTGADLDACPLLRGRPEGDRSGACIPISFMGRVLGVLHSASTPGDVPDADTMYQLTALVEQTGARLGNLRAFDRIQRQAAVDSLTGLPNRRSFEDAVHRLAVTGIPYGVLLADLDHFKVVNDTYGHAAGDRALRLFSDVVRSTMREEDIPCRFGGEEFAIVLPRIDVQGAAEVADRLRMALAVAVIGDGPAFTVSVGAADSTMARDLAGQLALADNALLAAKREGRDRCLIASPQVSSVS